MIFIFNQQDLNENYLPNIFDIGGLSRSEKILIMYLIFEKEYKSEDKIVTSIKKLTQKLESSERNITRIIDSLCRNDILVKQEENEGTRAVYLVQLFKLPISKNS